MSYLKVKQKATPLNSKVTALHEVTSESSGLAYIEQRLLSFLPEGGYQELLEDREVCIVVLSGRVTVSDFDQSFVNIGTRDSVFAKTPTDSVYIGRGKTLEIIADSAAKVMLCYAPCEQDSLPTKLLPASEVKLEERGKYQNRRYVQTILGDDSTVSEKLLVVEVYTAGGNWSSYPPHKHDQNNLPEESFLEETYYHEIDRCQGFVFQRVYTDDRSLDETMSVESGEIVLVPKGYHPVGVPDGYTSYYLNIMAGPIKKWQFHNDPDHEWIISRD